MRQILSCLLIILTCCVGTSEDNQEIQACFEAYKTAIVTNNGSKAAKKVSSNTFDYFARIQDLALYADYKELAKEEIFDRFLTLRIRAEFSAHQLKPMSAEDILTHITNVGWSGQDIDRVELSRIKVKDDIATSKTKQSGKKTEYVYTFHRETGVWKLDLTSMLPTLNAHAKQLSSRADLGDDNYIERALINAGVRYRRLNTIWEPLAARE